MSIAARPRYSRIVWSLDRTGQAVIGACGAVPGDGTMAVLTGSGTETELYALHLARMARANAITNIVVGGEETGSGVRDAASGRHFDAETGNGAQVEVSTPITGDAETTIEVRDVPVRDAGGHPRSSADLDGDVERLAAAAMVRGRRCLVHLLDTSKSGLRGPSIAAVRALKARFGDALEIVVDACQMRLARHALRSYLDDGWMVAVTGSKFYSAPPFCGALIVPHAIAHRIAEVDPLPTELGAYTARANWPGEWASLCAKLPAKPPDSHDIGMLLRWSAALCEIQRFDAIEPALRDRIVSELGTAISGVHQRCEWIRPLPTRAFEGAGDSADSRWRDRGTIFAFELLRDRANERMAPLTIDQARVLHRRLGVDLTGVVPAAGEDREILATPYFLGQPIKAARRGDGWTGALRISIGAPMVSTIAEGMERGASFDAGIRAVARQLERVHRKMELILRISDVPPTEAELRTRS